MPDLLEGTPRDQILDAAARLFVDRGFAGTSTRHIAEKVGIRQASLYYHFPAGKGEILAELLEMTVRPALDSLDHLDQVEGCEARLYALAFCDARALSGLMHNIGLLPSLPDVSCEEYDVARRELRTAYGTLGISCASDAVVGSISKRQLGDLILQIVESVIGARVAGDSVSMEEVHGVAASCLRACGVRDDRIETAAEAIRTSVL